MSQEPKESGDVTRRLADDRQEDGREYDGRMPSISDIERHEAKAHWNVLGDKLLPS